MTEPTDTNQASEDKLRKAVRDGLANHTGEFVNPWIFRKNYSNEELTDMLDDIMASENLFKNLQTIIRNEKLKLLAEVRERVVGEDETRIPADGGPFTNTTDKPNHYITLRNANRADQRAALTKLEAEL